MNSYCLHKTKQFYKSYINRSFDQDDVALFLTVIRDYSEKSSIFRELGDFLAHPEQKDRGLVINSINEIVDVFEEKCLTHTLNADVLPIFKSLSKQKLAKSLEQQFKKANIVDVEISENDLSFRDFVFCIIFILSQFRLKHNNKLLDLKVTYGHSLKLSASYQSKNMPNYFATLGVLSLHNVWVDYVDHLKSGYELDEFIARRLNNGTLVAISFEEDLSGNFSGAFERGHHWPLPDFER